MLTVASASPDGGFSPCLTGPLNKPPLTPLRRLKQLKARKDSCSQRVMPGKMVLHNRRPLTPEMEFIRMQPIPSAVVPEQPRPLPQDSADTSESEGANFGGQQPSWPSQTALHLLTQVWRVLLAEHATCNIQLNAVEFYSI